MTLDNPSLDVWNSSSALLSELLNNLPSLLRFVDLGPLGKTLLKYLKPLRLVTFTVFGRVV